MEILAYINISDISTTSPQLPDLTSTLEDLRAYLYWDAALAHNEVNIIDQQSMNYTTQRDVPLPLQLSTHSFSTKSSQPLQMFNGASSTSTNPTTVTSEATATDFSVDSTVPQVAVFGKRYKPVDKKVRPVLGALPEKFRIIRNITGDPLATMPTLQRRPPSFTPTGRYTLERMKTLEAAHSDGFLSTEEMKLLHHFMMLQNEGFAWTDTERGCFKKEYFPPIEIPTVPHIPWVQKNIPIPPGLYPEICEIIRTKIDAGVYEPSNSSYRSRWFGVKKKNGKTRIVHSLEPLNKVTIQHSGVTPIPDHLIENFACRACGAMLDLYVGYDERLLHESSRDLTTFQTPFGTLRLVTLPMGWANSVPIFHDDVTYILRPEIPEYTIPYIDDVPVKGPSTRYELPDGSFETIPENPGIRRFIWEHFETLMRVVQRMKYAGGTFSGVKLILCAAEILVLGHLCGYEGRSIEKKWIEVIANWGPCESLTELRAFLGTTGLCRNYIHNYAKKAYPLTYLTRKGVEFIFGEEQLQSQQLLKDAVAEHPCTRPINYDSQATVILASDACPIALGFYICQCDEIDPKKRYYCRFGSITLNERESRFSQAKLEIFGLYRAFREFKMYLLGIRNLVVEVDARYIKGMLQNPDIAPSASVNRWILAILTFQFELVHVPATHHGPDGLSRRPRQLDDEIRDEEALDDEFDDWIDGLYGFMHAINPSPFVDMASQNGPATVATFVKFFVPMGSDSVRQSNDVVEVFTQSAGIFSNNVTDYEQLSYSKVPRSEAAKREEDRLDMVRQYLDDLKRPPDLDDKAFNSFVRYVLRFFSKNSKLWRKDSQGMHKVVVDLQHRLEVLRHCHDDVGHKGFYATRAMVLERFWWPHIHEDLKWFIQTCHICQERQLRLVRIPPVVAQPAPLFVKVYVDVLHLPLSNGYRYIIQARCSLTHYPEYRALRKQTSQAVGDWIFDDLLCRWGALAEIVTDNGAPIISACDYLSKKYQIHHIRISGYNSQANGLVERSHFDVRQSLYKASSGDQSKWSKALSTVFWAERVTVRRRMGVSPYFAVTGTHPLLPLDIVEASYLVPPPETFLSTTDLIARRAEELQKRREQLERLRNSVYEARVKAARQFERDHALTIKDYDFKTGDLVLVRNTAIEKALNRKMRPRYNGPYVVVTRNRGGAYVVCELDGAVLDRPIAAFRVAPYFARKSLVIPTSVLDVHLKRIEEMRQSRSLGDDDENPRKTPEPDDDVGSQEGEGSSAANSGDEDEE